MGDPLGADLVIHIPVLIQPVVTYATVSFTNRFRVFLLKAIQEFAGAPCVAAEPVASANVAHPGWLYRESGDVFAELFKEFIRWGHTVRQQDSPTSMFYLQLRDEEHCKNRHVDLSERHCQDFF